MYEVHGWIVLSRSTDGELEDLPGNVPSELRSLIADVNSASVWADLRVANGEVTILISGLANRRRKESVSIDELLLATARSLPGSWGLIYDRDDETELPPGPNAYRVRVLARGAVEVRDDPFLSPCRPTIED